MTKRPSFVLIVLGAFLALCVNSCRLASYYTGVDHPTARFISLDYGHVQNGCTAQIIVDTETDCQYLMICNDIALMPNTGCTQAQHQELKDGPNEDSR